MPHEPRAKPLIGLKVLDLTQVLAGPYCTRLLADAGAEVIKIEPPIGDSTRQYPAVLGLNYSGYFLWLNCGKKSVVADLRTEGGRDLVKALAANADVFIENSRPGSLSRKGFGYNDLNRLNPNLIVCSISAFGHTGIFSDRAGHGIVAEGRAGVIDMTGYPDGSPVPPGVSLADVSAGIHAYAAIMTALYKRALSGGGGEFVDVSLFDAALPFHETALEEAEFAGSNPTRSGAEHRAVVPYGVYEAPDGFLVIAAGTQGLWDRLSALLTDTLGPARVDISTNEQRIQHRSEVRSRIQHWLEYQGSRDVALATLDEAGIPSGPIERVKDVAHGELAVSRGSFVSVPDHVLGQAWVLNTPYRMTNAVVGVTSRAPRLGEHTEKVTEALNDENGGTGWGTNL